MMLDKWYESIDKDIKYVHTQRKNTPDFHLHRGCEIYFLISGDIQYFVEKNIYTVNFGDLIITNNHEIHKPVLSPGTIYERITIEFNPQVARQFSSPDFDLLTCFYNRTKGENNKLTLNSEETSHLLGFFNKYAHLNKKQESGVEILKLSCFIELLVYINRLFAVERPAEDKISFHKKLLPVIEYIDQHLSDNLSLSLLEKKFFLSKFHLCKLFKKSTGSTIHEYIINKRVSAAKMHLESGCSVTETCLKSGFNDYTSFLKAFKRLVGILPKHYMKMYGNESRPF
jgi:AraC-like DNA-binding protein